MCHLIRALADNQIPGGEMPSIVPLAADQIAPTGRPAHFLYLPPIYVLSCFFFLFLFFYFLLQTRVRKKDERWRQKTRTNGK